MRRLITCLSVLGFLSLCRLTDAVEPWTRYTIDDTLRGADGVKRADFDGDGRPDIVAGWEEDGQTRVYIYPGRQRVRDKWPSVTVGRTQSVEDALPVDLNGDGSIDVVSLCEGNARSLFVHWGSHGGNRLETLDPASWRQSPHPPPLPRMQWMFAERASLRAEGEVSLIAGGKGEDAFIGRIVLRAAASDVRHPHPRPLPHPGGGEREASVIQGGGEVGAFSWQPLSPVGWAMSIVPMDMDGDGDEDVLLSDRRGPLRGVRWLENPLPDRDDAGQWQNHFIGGQDREVMFLTVADFDGDGLDDILVAAKPAGVLWFRRTNAKGDHWESDELSYPDGSGTAKAVAVGDIDLDGNHELVITCEGARDELSGVWWFRLGAGKSFKEGAWHDISGPEGTKYDLVELIDLDEDGDVDVLTCEESYQARGLGVVWYENPHH